MAYKAKLKKLFCRELLLNEQGKFISREPLDQTGGAYKPSTMPAMVPRNTSLIFCKEGKQGKLCDEKFSTVHASRKTKS
jgi:hypothetical protein